MTSIDQASRWVILSTVVLLFVVASRLAAIDGLLRPVTIDGPSMAPAYLGSHFVARCPDCSFPIAFDAEHLPRDDKIACPNCGQVASHENASARPPQRVLLDRWPLIWRGPRRLEVVAFHTADGELKIKRLAWLGGERPAIARGELFNGPTLIQKSPRELREVWLLVHDDQFRPTHGPGAMPRWHGLESATGWKHISGGYEHAGTPQQKNSPDWLIYEHWPGTFDQANRSTASPITDNDPYNQGESPRALNDVADVMLTCRVQARGPFFLVVNDGDQRIEIKIEPSRQATLRIDGEPALVRSIPRRSFRRAGELCFGLCDGQVVLVVNGKTIISHAYEKRADGGHSPPYALAIGALAAVKVEQLRVWRDIYYLDERGLAGRWQSPGALAADEVALLGDNQPVTIDSRHWEHPGVPRRALLGLVYKPFWATQNEPAN